MSDHPDPSRTWAVIVGIDQYQDVAIGDLQNQVDHACKFARWLLDRGVLPDHILLFLSPIPASIDLNVVPKNAKENAIFDSFDQIIRNNSESPDLLFVYWGGHGLIAGDERALLTEDAAMNSLRSINLNSLLSSLRTEYFGFEQQVFILDACARHFPNKDEIKPREFRQLNRIANKKQFVLYSAADTEAARDGLFSPLVLDWLARNREPAWLPDLEELAKYIKTEFLKLRQEGKALQTPIYFSHKSWEGEEERLIGEFNMLRLLREAREMFRKVEIKLADWQECYFRTLKGFSNDSISVESLDHAIYSLAQSVPPKRIEPLLEFAWRVALKLPQAKQQKPIKKWVADQVHYRTLLTDLEDRLRAEPDKEKMVFLMIEVLEASPGLMLHVWLASGGQFYDLGRHTAQDSMEGLRAAICTIVQKLEAGSLQGYNGENIFLEIFVPLRLLKCDADREKHGFSPLGAAYPVVLRWHERLSERSPIARPLVWRRVAERLHKELPVKTEQTNFWVPDDEDNYERLNAHCSSNDFSDSFLGFSIPVIDASTNEVSLFLQAALSGGIPYAFWSRVEVTRQFKDHFNDAVKSLNRWEELPEAVRKMRKKVIGNATHPVAEVTLLWDDPRRVPPQTTNLP